MSAEDMKKQPTVAAWILVQPPAVEPSWARVLLTTLSLWLSRRLRRAAIRPVTLLPLCVSALVLLLLGMVTAGSAGPLAQRILELIYAGALGLALIYVMRALVQRAQGRHRRVRTGLAMAGFSARGLTILAAVLAGRGGSALLQEWTAHLAGESGHDAASWGKVRQSAGFIIAGLSHRCSNWADAAWRPADAVLRSRTLSNLFVLLPTGVDAYLVLRHEGTIGLLTTFESIFVCGAMLYGVIKAGRWYRDVEPPEPKARRSKEDQGA